MMNETLGKQSDNQTQVLCKELDVIGNIGQKALESVKVESGSAAFIPLAMKAKIRANVSALSMASSSDVQGGFGPVSAKAGTGVAGGHSSAEAQLDLDREGILVSNPDTGLPALGEFVAAPDTSARLGLKF